MTILDTYKAGKYTALILSETLPEIRFNKIIIDGVEYIPEPVYEIDNEIAVIASEDYNFKGKKIQFLFDTDIANEIKQKKQASV